MYVGECMCSTRIGVCGHAHIDTAVCLCKGVCTYDTGIGECVDHVCNCVHLTLLSVCMCGICLWLWAHVI